MGSVMTTTLSTMHIALVSWPGWLTIRPMQDRTSSIRASTLRRRRRRHHHQATTPKPGVVVTPFAVAHRTRLHRSRVWRRRWREALTKTRQTPTTKSRMTSHTSTFCGTYWLVQNGVGPKPMRCKRRTRRSKRGLAVTTTTAKAAVQHQVVVEGRDNTCYGN